MSDFSTKIFNKTLDELTFDDLELYFQEEREESNILEFKSGQTDKAKFDDVLNKKIIRAISSFLNSEGGILIWGSPYEVEREKAGKKIKVAQGALQYNTVFNEKDQLINKIISSISFLPTGIKIKILEKQNHFIYIFEVQESSSKPHQYLCQYFIRIDGQSIAAPHYLVDSLFKQVRSPEIEGFLSIDKASNQYGISSLYINMLIFNFSPHINDKNIFYQITTSIGQFSIEQYHTIKNNTNSTLHYGTPYGRNLVIQFSDNDLFTQNHQLKLSLVFGGEFSNAKTCYYEFNLNGLLSGKFNFKKHMVSILENVTFKEHQENLGTSKDSILSSVLNR